MNRDPEMEGKPHLRDIWNICPVEFFSLQSSNTYQSAEDTGDANTYLMLTESRAVWSGCKEWGEDAGWGVAGETGGYYCVLKQTKLQSAQWFKQAYDRTWSLWLQCGSNTGVGGKKQRGMARSSCMMNWETARIVEMRDGDGTWTKVVALQMKISGDIQGIFREIKPSIREVKEMKLCQG